MEKESLIYDWNDSIHQSSKEIHFDDETLRDGLQSPSINQPTIDQKIELLHQMNDLGIQIADIGLPAASRDVYDDVLMLAKEIESSKLNIKAACAARTLVNDIAPIAEIAQKTSTPIEVHAFMGSSPIRRYAESWDIDKMVKTTAQAIDFSVANGCPIMYVTEDTVRTDPETLKILIGEAIARGASRVCICDTVGHCLPSGVKKIIYFVKNEIIRPSGKDIKIDWHGHSDRGLSLANALTAVKAGADRIHGTCLGIGERSGNTPIDLLLVNMKIMGIIDQNLTSLKDYCENVSTYCQVPISDNYPLVGKDAFRTGTGVHAAAIIKSKSKEEDAWISDLIYSAVPAEDYGFSQKIEIGPMSGKSNIEYWLNQKGLEIEENLVNAIFSKAKLSKKMLCDNEINEIIVNQYISKTTKEIKA